MAVPKSALICGECKTRHLKFWSLVFEDNLVALLRKDKFEEFLQEHLNPAILTAVHDQPNVHGTDGIRRAVILAHSYVLPVSQKVMCVTGAGAVVYLACEGFKYTIEAGTLTSYLTRMFSLDASLYTLLDTIFKVSSVADQAVGACVRP